jgi:hypothetical protein
MPSVVGRRSERARNRSKNVVKLADANKFLRRPGKRRQIGGAVKAAFGALAVLRRGIIFLTVGASADIVDGSQHK